MGADRQWTRDLFGCALVPDLVLYLKIDPAHLVPRVLEGKGMDYWESGMHLALGSDIFDSFFRYQTRLIREYNRLAREFRFTSVDARNPIDQIQGDLRRHISAYLERSKAATSGGEPAATPAVLRR
jgi:dTMP kinase